MKNISNLESYNVVSMSENELRLVEGGWLGTACAVVICGVATFCKMASEAIIGGLMHK